MNNNPISSEKSLQDYYNRVSTKIRAGFTVKEKNDKLPFAILSREARAINHTFNFVLFCLTFGLWSIVWLYLTFVYGKEKRILIAIDEDGKTFEERCY
ncbi:MAG: hypothetical protein RIR67_1043 [Bacteroidota bacterium]|jgi:hypothetical protein|uniref:hypothetical protein n=1 Tax=Flavobacterium sp. TaxID=239 RepID=UPI00286F9F55|nr:hypothetical protein [Flavobacterium sp.]